MSLMAANEESDPSVILNGFWVTLLLHSGYQGLTVVLFLL